MKNKTEEKQSLNNEVNSMGETNVDHILVLRKTEDDLLSVEKVQIEHPKEVLDKLSDFENRSCYDIFDVVRYVGQLDFDKMSKFSYCWPYEYSRAYVMAASVRPMMQLSNEHVLIEFDTQKWKSAYEKDLSSVKHRVELEYAAKKRPGFKMERFEYLRYVSNLESEMRRKIRQEQDARRAEIKNEYIDEVRRAIYGMCYYQKLSQIKPSVLMYSSENIGWYNPDYVIADGVKVSVRTNFCYGKSAYFHVNLKYKGINILPYSDIITYYWSNMMDNVRYTKDYEPNRSNWKYALPFIQDISNLIATDSDKFEKEWIIDNVEAMMAGLVTINDNIKEYYSKLEAARRKEELDRGEGVSEEKIIRYRSIDDWVVKRYKIYEHETLLVVQVDKLSAALSLLEDLSTIRNIYSPIVGHMRTIVGYNEKVLPAINACLEDLERKLADLGVRLESALKQQESAKNEMQIIKIEIDKELEESCDEYQKWSTMNINRINMLRNHCEKNGHYVELEKQCCQLTEEINKVRTEKSQRESFARHLKNKGEYIEKTLKEYQID